MTTPRKHSEKKPNIVALALDDKMVYAFFVIVHSLVSTATQPFSLIVGHFTGHLASRHKNLIQSFVESLGVPTEIQELNPNPLFTERRHLTITTFSKFVISDAVREPHLWIDLDTVAMPGWDEFFQHLTSAPESASLIVARKLESPHTRFDGFNAGILGWTSAPRADWVPALASLPEKRFSSEQFLFNTLYAKTAHAVDVKFNFLSSWHANAKELRRAVIIHYSGPIKPWHLAGRHRAAWKTINPSWQHWFDAEDSLHRGTAGSAMRKELRQLRRAALFSGRVHTGKGALAALVMRCLAVLGPLGDPLVWFLVKRSQS